MHYTKPTDQVKFIWTPPLPFNDLGQRKNMCTRIFQTQLELKLKLLKIELM